MTSHPPFFWVKQIHAAVEEIPLWGSPPPFPLEACAEKLALLLNIPKMSLVLEHEGVRTSDKLTAGLGSSPLTLVIELSPLSEPFYWLMAQEDVAQLVSFALFTHNGGSKGFSNQVFQEGFYRFLALQAAEIIDKLTPFEDLSVRIGSQCPLPKESALCIDVGIQTPKRTLWGRIVCPESFRRAFKAHFSTRPFSLEHSPMTGEIPVILRARVGHTLLRLAQWSAVAVGDFILLDDCSFDPVTHKGTVLLTLENTPLLRARLKAESVKIIDYAFYYEETMNENEDFSEEEPISPAEEETSIEGLIPTPEIELLLTVEIARVHIHLDKLLQLKPGNVLELPIRPEQGVDISIGGKRVAKAELVKIGDLLGIKILQLGS